MVSASFFLGYILTPLPGGIMAEKFGTKYLFAGAALISAIVTTCLPLLATAGFPYFILGRAFIGFVQVLP